MVTPLEGLIAATALATVVGVAAGFVAWRYWKDRPRLYHRALVDGEVGLVETVYRLRDGAFEFDYNGEDIKAQPLLSQQPALVKKAGATVEMRLFTVSEAGAYEVPVSDLVRLPGELIEGFYRDAVYAPNANGKEHEVFEEGLQEVVKSHGFRESAVRSIVDEILVGIRGLVGAKYAHDSWRSFVLGHAQALGMGAIALVLMGLVLGINLMLDPYFFSLMASETATWILLALVTLAMVGVMWGEKRA